MTNNNTIWLNWIAPLAIVGLAAVLRFWDLDRTSLWLDEVWTWQQVHLPFWAMISAMTEDFHPPLNNLITWSLVQFFGDSETVLRLPAAVFGTGAVWMLYRLGKTLWNTETGLLAAFFLAISPFHVWYSTEARMYALLSFTATGFIWSLVRLFQIPGHVRSVLASAAGLALIASHVYGSFTFIAVNGFIAFACVFTAVIPRRVQRDWLISQVAAVVLFAPWMFVLADRVHHVVTQGFWIQYPDLNSLMYWFGKVAGSLTVLGFLTILALLSFLPRKEILQRVQERAWKPQISWQVALVCVWAFTPPVAGYLLSIALQPILFDRYMSGAWPGFLLLAAAGATAASRHFVPLLAAAIVFILLANKLDQTVRTAPRNDWRQIAGIFETHRNDNDVLTFSWNQLPRNLSYYVRDLERHESVDFKEIGNFGGDGTERLWLFSWTDRVPQSVAVLTRTWKIEQQWDVSGVHAFLFVRK